MNCHSFSLFKCLRGVLHSVTPLCYVLAKQFPGCVFRCPVPHGSPWRLCDISFRETPFLFFFSRFHEKSKTLKPQDIHWSPEDPAKFRKSNLRPGVHGHLGVLQCATVQKRPGAVVKPWGTTDLGCARCLLERSWEMAMVYHGILLLGYNGVCGVYIISINLSYPTLSYPTLPYPILYYPSICRILVKLCNPNHHRMVLSDTSPGTNRGNRCPNSPGVAGSLRAHARITGGLMGWWKRVTMDLPIGHLGEIYGYIENHRDNYD